MRISAGILLALLIAAGCTPASPTTAPGPDAGRLAYLDQLPPLIDREVFFDDPQIAGGQISPDGRFISFRRPLDGVMNIWVKERSQSFEEAWPVTDDRDRPIVGYFWSQDSRFILFAQDRGGDENFRVYAVDPRAERAPGERVPPARDLTPYERVQARIISVPENTPNQILVAINDRDPALHDVYRVDLRTAERQLVIRNEANVFSWVADLEGRLRLGARMTEDGRTEILQVEGDRLTPIHTVCGLEQGCGPFRFHRDGRRVYLVNDRDADLTYLALFDLQTRQEEKLESDPENQADFGGAEFSRATRELVATYYVGDRLRVYPRDAQFARDYENVRRALPEGDIYFGASTRDDRLHIVSVTSDVDPGATYLYDRSTGEVELLYRPRPNLPSEHLARMEPIRYRARDGVEIPAYLTIPRGVQPRQLGVVVLPHGGPWGRDYWGYNSWAQFLANRGYAVLQPNFRGSTGFGKRFLDLGNFEWGTGAMQHDISDGVRFLIEQGIADPRRVGIMGGSYGGYATLAGVAFTPDLYAAGVSIVGPSNIVTLLRSIPPYWGPIRRVFDLRVGSLDDAAHVERMRAQSPLFAAERIRAPLLVIQGANDPRVVKHESDQIVVAMRDLGRTVEYLVAWDEGHGFQGRENRLAMFAEIERFLAEHLGGRYQQSMPAEIRTRLAELRADVDTLRLPTVANGDGDAGAAAPATFTGAALRPMTLRYQQNVQVGGQTMQATSTRTVASATWEGQPVWTVVEEAQTPMGAALDSVYLARETLLPLRRAARQGPATIELTFDEGRVQGRMQAGPQQMPIDAAVEGRVLTDGAPLELAIGTLPLAPGYQATLHTFNFMEGRARPQRLQVTGTEQVEVPAGTFEVFRVELTPADGSPGGATLWVERAAPHRVVRSEARLPPQMGGGTVAAELVGGEAR